VPRNGGANGVRGRGEKRTRAPWTPSENSNGQQHRLRTLATVPDGPVDLVDSDDDVPEAVAAPRLPESSVPNTSRVMVTRSGRVTSTPQSLDVLLEVCFAAGLPGMKYLMLKTTTLAPAM
jgi:hypothetical protein